MYKYSYNKDGKVIKIFGPHDNDGLKIVKNFFKILFITADKKGYQISKKRRKQNCMEWNIIFPHKLD